MGICKRKCLKLKGNKVKSRHCVRDKIDFIERISSHCHFLQR